jgi:hypothetical protein
MKKFVVKPQGTLSFRPHVETLECRAQPGSVLGLGSSVLGAAALDLNADLGSTQRPEQDTVSELRLTHDNDLALHVNYQETSQTSETAPVQFAAVSSAPGQASANSALSIQDQVRSVAAGAAAQAAATTHTAATLSSSSVSSQTRLTNQGQIHNQSQTNGNNYQASALALSAQSLGTAHANVSANPVQTRSFGGLTSRAFSVNTDHAPPPAANPVYVSYMVGLNPDGSAAGASSINGVRFNPSGDGSLFISGSVTDPGTGLLDGFVGLVSADGSSLVGRTFGSTTANVVANAVDVSPTDGSIYVVGTVTLPDGSASADFLARVEGDVQTLDWISQLTVGGTFDAYNGVKDATDPNLGQEAVYVTGTFGDPTTGNKTIAILEIINLNAANPPDPTAGDVMGGAFAFSDPNGLESNSVGNSISVDANGQAYVAVTYGLNDGSDSTAFMAASASGITTASGVFLLFNTGAGQTTNGSYGSVSVDPNSGIAYLSGTLRAYPTVGNDHLTLALSAFTIDTVAGTFTSYYLNGSQQVGAWLWQLTIGTNMFVDWLGGTNGNAVIPGSFDGSRSDQAINSFANDPNNPGGTLIVWRVVQNGNASLDANLQFIPTGGAADDEAVGLDIAPNTTFGGNDYAQGGFTASTDFLTLGTPAPFQATDPDTTGAFNQGWVSKTNFS